VDISEQCEDRLLRAAGVYLRIGWMAPVAGLVLASMTIRAVDGTIHVFNASKETLQDLKARDHIEARLRQP
jgi:hypothetical protein